MTVETRVNDSVGSRFQMPVAEPPKRRECLLRKHSAVQMLCEELVSFWKLNGNELIEELKVW